MRVLSFILLISVLKLHAQKDSVVVLTPAEYMHIVQQYHPLAKQAALLPERARAELTIARGGFDPYLYSDYNRKQFDAKNYYSFFENHVKIPAWYGIELKGGYDVAYGQNINPEDKLPPAGLGYVGISVPLVKNLFFDKRRAALRQAEIFRTASEFQQLALLNDLLLDALKTYYEWSYSYNTVLIFERAVKLADVRYRATQGLVAQGDRPAIDTVEALTQLQSRQFSLNEARLYFRQMQLELSTYLWFENNQAIDLGSRVVPVELTSDFLQDNIDMQRMEEWQTKLQQQHPIVRVYQYKIKQLDIDRRLKLENLKPSLNAGYNLLLNQPNTTSVAALLANNYKLGINFNMPLTFAQGRGEWKVAKLKIQEANYDLEWKRAQLMQKFNASLAELLTLRDQTKLYEEALRNFQRLYEGEQTRFLTGESTLFLVNARETKVLEIEQKLRELQAKYYKAEVAMKWAAGAITELK